MHSPLGSNQWRHNGSSLQTAVQRRSRQVGDRRLQSVKAIVQWQQRMAPECHDHRLLSLRQHGGSRLGRPGLHILDRRALAPLRNGLGIDTQLTAQLRERSLRSLYCCSDGVRGRGAPVTYLSHMASFHSNERIAPSNRGIKHLGRRYCRFIASYIKVPTCQSSERYQTLNAQRHKPPPCSISA